MINRTSVIKPTALVLLFTIVFSFFTFEYWPNWQRGVSTPFEWDVQLYYSYLPATFIEHDLTFNYPNNFPMAVENGNHIPKYTCGMAIMYMPFFLLGHKVAYNQHSPLTGFSEPYATCVHAGSIFYVLLGLIFLAKVLRRFYSENITALLIAIAFFGTNLFFYTLAEGEYSHGYLFCLVSVFAWQVIRWHEKRSFGLSIGLGLILGLMTLIRPTDIIYGLVFLFYGVASRDELKSKMQLLWQSKWKLVVMVLCIFVALLPQLIYWKVMTGHFLYFSYGDERFFFNDPKIVQVLFSYRKGWLVYTPVMILSVIGFFFLKRYARAFVIGIPLFFILNLYIVASWWCWWYGGSFGMRALIDSYPLMIICMGAFLTWLINERSAFRWLAKLKAYGAMAFVMCCICLNIVQVYQYKKNMIHFDSMNKEAYWQVFDKFEFKYNEIDTYYKSLKQPDYPAAMKGGAARD